MEHEPVGGFLDGLFGTLKPDPAKIDKAKLKSAVALGMDAMKPATTWPGNIDDMMYDQLKNVANTYIDKLGVSDGGPVTVGADRPYTAADVDAYLGTFEGVDAEVRTKLRRKPKLLNLVKEEFTSAEQKKLVGNPFLIGLLSIFGPLIVEWIKNWLSRN